MDAHVDLWKIEEPDAVGGDAPTPVTIVETSVSGAYIASGDLSVLGTHVVALTFDAAAARSKSTNAAAVAVGGAGLAAQVLNGINTGRGQVRLSPDTIATLKAGQSRSPRTAGTSAR